MADRKHDPAAPPARERTADLGYAPMDSVHAELDQLLHLCRQPGRKDWLDLLSSIHDHLRGHFEVEDTWMRETGFPPRECHIDEHAAVLKSSAHVLAHAREGDFSQAEGFTAELARWFPGHADFLDSALAAWMCKRQYGGKPVVVHRSRTGIR